MTLDELADHGLERMDDEAIRRFLDTHGIGVLGLSTDGAPYLLPMSYGYDGEGSLYFNYVVGAASRKADLSAADRPARFLVYEAQTAFNWRSVMLSGHLDSVPSDEREAIERDVTLAWRPELFERAGDRERTELYRFAIEGWSGVNYTGLPPGLAD